MTCAAIRHPGLRQPCSARPTLPSAADKHAIPKVDNTNVDRSVATIHTTVLGCLRRTARVSGTAGDICNAAVVAGWLAHLN